MATCACTFTTVTYSWLQIFYSPKKYQGPWNFGPSKADNCSVGQLLEIFENAGACLNLFSKRMTVNQRQTYWPLIVQKQTRI